MFILAALMFLGATMWAVRRDPFDRVWFQADGPVGGAVQCVAVRSKTSPKRAPVVCYLHDSGDTLATSGDRLRQIAEMGLAAVGIGYNQTNATAFETQFTALLDQLSHVPWADPGRMAWVGRGVGAQRLLRFALEHRDRQPALLVLLSTDWGAELEVSKAEGDLPCRMEHDAGGRVLAVAPQISPPAVAGPPAGISVLVMHLVDRLHFRCGDRAHLSEAQELAARLQTNGMAVCLKEARGDVHGNAGDLMPIFRAVGERCLECLAGPQAFEDYRSISSWQAGAAPLWVYEIPALVWAVWSWRGWAQLAAAGRGDGSPGVAADGSDLRADRARERAGERAALSGRGMALRCVTAILAAAALGETALQVVLPRVPASPAALRMARGHLVPPKQIADFDWLASQPAWASKKVKTLLENVDLANYNRELVDWKVGEAEYREFVLSPLIGPAFDGQLAWRRPLWESLYPRIRGQPGGEAVAAIVVRHLRARVTVREGVAPPATIEQVWRRQCADEHGFEAVYVAALRSVGVPARLDGSGRAELCDGSSWKPAPRPVVEAWERTKMGRPAKGSYRNKGDKEEAKYESEVCGSVRDSGKVTDPVAGCSLPGVMGAAAKRRRPGGGG